MSGERVVLAGGADGNAARLVKATARLAEADLGPHALIGGLAVMCRLAAVHRATQDVDTVTETTAPSAVEVIASSIGSTDLSNPNRVLVDGVKIDVIDTEGFRHEDLDGVGPEDRLFVISHRWALDTATGTEIVAGGAVAAIRVATPSALVAMKSGAVLRGRPRDPRKRASDLYDVYRLLLEYDRAGAVAESLTAAPFRLGSLVGDALRTRIVDEPERAVRWLLGGGQEMGAVTPDDLSDVVGPLVNRLLS
ncbi:nucleotidyl transferase AbiEii/AbiGii toxin family protein [Iamia sp.]|uniref:nucleotidyl transferase AbiEii/AbiGii toxin family protein n=1 Tax=Iamia sp. TaxID=2722710 RepID=UPI002BED3065|nr:nucleotidyl transferase AbiEii/AbiGii toxin family protein [Iamia sp.]HXH55801.1 nucleotidyl transferase AbiEii/AbiGii toxin family protein [Iamia sp.]